MMEGKTEYGYRWRVDDMGMRKHKSIILTDDEYARNIELERQDLKDMLKALDECKEAGMNLIKVVLTMRDGTTEEYVRDLGNRKGLESFARLMDVARSFGTVCTKIENTGDRPTLIFGVE